MAKHEKLRSVARLFADAEQASFIVALDGTIVTWNTAAAHAFGIPAWQAIGRPCPGVVGGCSPDGTPFCRVGCAVQRDAAAGRSSPPMDLVLGRGRPREGRRLRMHLLGLKDEHGTPLGVLHLVEDVHQHRLRERIGLQLEALSSGRAFGGSAVHSLLTQREREVFRLLAEGRTAREVAGHLGISHTTARTHTQRILSKLGVRNRVAALARALECGEVPAEQRGA
jgi:DNA-binding CsgD family transcriptional regulator